MTVAAVGAPARQRVLVLRMDAAARDAILGIGTSVLTGAVGLELLKRFFAWRRQRRDEPTEITAKILDDGDELRRILLEQVQRLQAEKDLATERAHRVEIDLAILRLEHERLKTRLERKDAAALALHNQVMNLGGVPVVAVAATGRQGET